MTSGTNLIFHHRIADIVNHAAKLVHILSVGEELCEFASLRQRNQVFENIVQFSINNQHHAES